MLGNFTLETVNVGNIYIRFYVLLRYNMCNGRISRDPIFTMNNPPFQVFYTLLWGVKNRGVIYLSIWSFGRFLRGGGGQKSLTRLEPNSAQAPTQFWAELVILPINQAPHPPINPLARGLYHSKKN